MRRVMGIDIYGMKNNKQPPDDSGGCFYKVLYYLKCWVA